MPEKTLQSDQVGNVQSTPTLLSYFVNQKRKVKQIATGEAHTIVLDDLGHVYTFGWGELGQLGVAELLGKSDADGKINRLELFTKLKCTKIAAGSVSSAALTTAGHVYVWGSQ